MYKPMSHLYRGDKNMRVYVAQISKQQNRDIPKKYNNDKNNITFNTFKRAQNTRRLLGRLCGDLEIFQKHFFTKGNVNNPKAYEVCGIYSYTTCGL